MKQTTHGNTNLTRSNNVPIKKKHQEQLIRTAMLFQISLENEKIQKHIILAINLLTKV
jgi:hypothetical protein